MKLDNEAIDVVAISHMPVLGYIVGMQAVYSTQTWRPQHIVSWLDTML